MKPRALRRGVWGLALLALGATVSAQDRDKPRPLTADGHNFPSPQYCSLTANLPVVHRAFGGLPEGLGLRKVFSVRNSDEPTKSWVRHLAAEKIDATTFDYIGPGRDFGAESVLIGLDGGRVKRLLFYFPRMTPAKVADFTSPFSKAGVVDQSDSGESRFQIDGMRLVGTLVGSHAWTVTKIDPNSTHQNFFMREHDVTYEKNEYPSAVEIQVDRVDWYVATHHLSDEVAKSMSRSRLCDGMTYDQAALILGNPNARSTGSSGLVTLTWHRRRKQPDGDTVRTDITATLKDDVVVQFHEDEGW